MRTYYYFTFVALKFNIEKTNLPIYEKQTLFIIAFYFAFYNCI